MSEILKVLMLSIKTLISKQSAPDINEQAKGKDISRPDNITELHTKITVYKHHRRAAHVRLPYWVLHSSLWMPCYIN